MDVMAMEMAGWGMAERVREVERKHEAEAGAGAAAAAHCAWAGGCCAGAVRLLPAVQDREGGGSVKPRPCERRCRSCFLFLRPQVSARQGLRVCKSMKRTGLGCGWASVCADLWQRIVRGAVVEAMPLLRLGDKDMPVPVAHWVSMKCSHDRVRCRGEVVLAVELRHGVPEWEAGDTVAVVVQELNGIPEGEMLMLRAPKGLGFA